MRSNFSLTPEQREDARKAIHILEGTGISLTAAAGRAVHGLRAQRQVTVNEAGALFLASRRAGGARPKTVTWYEEMLAVFARDFGEKKLDDITRPKLLAWIKGRSAGSQPHYFRVVRALFRWAAAQETRLVGLDPTANVEIEEVRKDKTIRFLTVAEAETVLRKDVRHRAAHALSLFAGVRPEEIAGKGKTWLPWSAVNEEERILRIPAECSKTRRARIIEGLPEALWLWLATIPREERGESVGVAAAQQVARAARSALGLKKWPQDVMRHTFATYAVALTGDPAKVSLWLGHEGRPTLLHTTYRGLATKAQAEAFFGLRP